MGLRDSFLAGLAKQLGHPSGLRGRMIGTMLNRGNRATITRAVEALELEGGETVADIGFGGGLGLALLLRATGEKGTVHGVDISETMLARARAGFRADVAAGRLRLQEGSITALPLADSSLDAAITVNTVYFVDDLDRALADVARVLAPGARFVLAIGDPASMAGRQGKMPGFRIRPLDVVETALAGAGLTVIGQSEVPRRDFSFRLFTARRHSE
jgi:SAM-dependent methyltransferase